MQQYTRDRILDYARRHDWPVITVTDEGKAKTTRRAIDIIRRELRV